jgi:hypothetical protein
MGTISYDCSIVTGKIKDSIGATIGFDDRSSVYFLRGRDGAAIIEDASCFEDLSLEAEAMDIAFIDIDRQALDRLERLGRDVRNWV